MSFPPQPHVTAATANLDLGWFELRHSNLESPFPGDLEDEGPYILQQKWFGLPGHDPDRLLPWTRPLTAATHSRLWTTEQPVDCCWVFFFTLLLFKMLNLLLDHRSVIFPDLRSDRASVGVTWKDFNQFFICRFKHFRKKKKKGSGALVPVYAFWLDKWLLISSFCGKAAHHQRPGTATSTVNSSVKDFKHSHACCIQLDRFWGPE